MDIVRWAVGRERMWKRMTRESIKTDKGEIKGKFAGRWPASVWNWGVGCMGGIVVVVVVVVVVVMVVVW